MGPLLPHDPQRSMPNSWLDLPTSYSNYPVVLTHWDPDVYPRYALPLVQELIIHILAHGEVWLKEVDLFLNPRIRRALSDPRSLNFQAFRSLVDTGRIKILIPPRTTSQDRLDPQDYPLGATAMARDGKKPLKSKRWFLNEETRRFCARLDSILGRAGRQSRGFEQRQSICRARRIPPSGNEFAAKLCSVLNQRDRRWKRRPQFSGITPKMADQFMVFCQNPDAALKFLAAKHVQPNATDGFYRSLAYQCADLFPLKSARAMKNLVQSVYAYCELKRERAAGTYGGDRLAEMPPDRPIGQELVRIEVAPMPQSVNIPLTANIGDVISAVLEECEPSLRVFWGVAGESPSPEREFQIAWNHVAEVFARNAALSQRTRKSGTFKIVRFILHGVKLLMELGEIAGHAWIPAASPVSALPTTIATFGPQAVDLIRSARIELRRQKITDCVNAAAAIRCSKIM
jgi:hypothetical protein